MVGVHRARRSASFTYPHRTFSAALARDRSCCCSAAKDFTTRTPLMFSSTMVATSASRAWMIHDTGNIDFRIFTPVR